jgi:hypothetical protein
MEIGLVVGIVLIEELCLDEFEVGVSTDMFQ